MANHSYITMRVPQWLKEHQSRAQSSFPTTEEQMSFVIELSQLNIQHRTGGPFAAAVFHMGDGSLLAAGVNLVLSGRCSVLHAEIVALVIAQQKAGHYDLSSAGLPHFVLVTSTEPCAMCLGAVMWSGIRKLVCGACGADAEIAGFDEGEKPSHWAKAFERRGVSVQKDVCREQAAAVLRDYRAAGGRIYNPSRCAGDLVHS